MKTIPPPLNSSSNVALGAPKPERATTGPAPSESSRFQVTTDRGSYILELSGNPSEADVRQLMARLSDADLEAMSTGNMSGVSDEGLPANTGRKIPMITVRHPVAGTVQFPGGTSEGEMARAMRQLDASTRSYTKDQIRDYARQLGAKGASADEIEAFVSSAMQNMVEDKPGKHALTPQDAPKRPSFMDETMGDLLRERGGYSSGGSAAKKRAEAAGVAALSRYGVPLLQPQGGIGGAATGTAGEAFAQLIEGGTISDKGAVAAAGTMNAVPLAGIKAPLKALQNVARMASGAYVGEQVRSLIDEKQASDKATKTAGIVAAITAASPLLGKAIGRVVGHVAPEEAARVAAEKSRNATRDATLAAGRDAGYVVPPSAVNPSWLNKRLESVAGKAAVAQEAAVRNQEITNRLAKKAVGLPDDTSITEAILEQVRKDAAAPYREVAALSPAAAVSLEALKQARSDASTFYKHYARSADPASLKSARDAAALAEKLENGLEATATAAGRPELLPALREARQQIAKTYSVEGALNLGDGNVAAPYLGRALDKGAPLSDELETAAKFQQAFPTYMREAASVPTPGVSKVEAGMGALLGLSTGALTKNPYLATAAAALPAVASPAARNVALSPLYQDLMAKRSYAPKTSAPEGLNEILARLGAITAAQKLAAEPLPQ